MKISVIKVTVILVIKLTISTSFIFSQTLPIPVDQDVVIIDESEPGKLETIINGDIDGNGKRVNPNRIYMLKSGKIYVQIGPITFGGDTDSTALLTIIGEEGGARPMVVMNPGAGGGAFKNIINGSLTLKNLYWGATNLNGESATLFDVRKNQQRIIAEGLVVENMFGGSLFSCDKVHDELDVYIKNCYFRDFSQLANSWNHFVLRRGDNGQPIDTLWIENTTVTHSGMPFFGKLNSVNFMYFNHNSIINTAKYPIWFERYKEAYITNNLFINANFEGECKSTWETQIGEDFIPSGLINLDTIESRWFSPEITPDDVIFYAADNLAYTSQYLDNYWAGDYNSIADYPISNRAWTVPPDELPSRVFGPVPLFNERILNLANTYDNIILERNHIDVDPQMVTKGIANQNVGNQFAYFARNNYYVAEPGEMWDKSLMYFGDADPSTIPGNGAEDGYSITDMADFPEDFSYASDIRSGIDDKPIGALSWWSEEMNTWQSDSALKWLVNYYKNMIRFSSYPVLESNIGEEYIYQATIQGRCDTGKFYLSSTPAASWLAIDSLTGLIQGTPSVSDTGSYAITIIYSCTEKEITQFYNLKVSDNYVTPSFTSLSVESINVEDKYVYQVTFQGGYDTGKFYLSSTPEASWLMIDSLSGLVTGRPSLSDTGSYEILITYNDSRSEISQFYTLEIIDTYVEPFYTSKAPETVNVNEEYIYQVMIEGGYNTGVFYLNTTPEASWLVIDSLSGLIKGTPSISDTGSYVFIITFDDKRSELLQNFTLQVMSNSNGNQYADISLMKVYPNPVRDIFYVNMGIEFEKFHGGRIEIMNLDGKILFTHEIQQQIVEIDVRKFGSSGIYVLKLISDKGQIIDVQSIVLD